MTDTLDVAPASGNGTASGEHSDRLQAAVRAAQRVHSTPATLPFVGEIHLPAGDEVGFALGIGALAVVGALEWPVAVVLCTGRVLAHVHRSRAMAAFGNALEHA